MASGSTALTVARVPTGMKAGVRMSPCGVEIMPVRPRAPSSSLPTVNTFAIQSGQQIGDAYRSGQRGEREQQEDRVPDRRGQDREAGEDVGVGRARAYAPAMRP